MPMPMPMPMPMSMPNLQSGARAAEEAGAPARAPHAPVPGAGEHQGGAAHRAGHQGKRHAQPAQAELTAYARGELCPIYRYRYMYMYI
jgi:hypothetical protein